MPLSGTLIFALFPFHGMSLTICSRVLVVSMLRMQSTPSAGSAAQQHRVQPTAVQPPLVTPPCKVVPAQQHWGKAYSDVQAQLLSQASVGGQYALHTRIKPVFKLLLLSTLQLLQFLQARGCNNRKKLGPPTLYSAYVCSDSQGR